MNTREFVEAYTENSGKKFKRFILTQLILDIVEIPIYIFILLKIIDNTNAVNISIIVFFVVFYASLMLNIRHHFGGLKAFLKDMSIRGKYTNALKEFEKSDDSNTFDQILAELEKEING